MHRSELACTDARRMATQSPPDAHLARLCWTGYPHQAVKIGGFFRIISIYFANPVPLSVKISELNFSEISKFSVISFELWLGQRTSLPKFSEN